MENAGRFCYLELRIDFSYFVVGNLSKNEAMND